METRSQIRGHLAALLTITIWGITFISIKVLLVPFTAVEIMFYRLALALVALLATSSLLARGKTPKKAGPESRGLRDEWKYMGAGLCGVTLYFLFQNTALTYTLAANVSVLISVAPLFTALGVRYFYQERLKPHFFLGFAAAMAGIILITFNGSIVLKLNPLGDLLSILAAAAWAFYVVLIRKIEPQQADVLSVTRKVFFYGILFMLPVLPLSGFRWGLERMEVLPNLLNLLFLGVGASALCFVTWNYAVGVLGPVKTSVYIYVIPVITILAGALLLHEPITPVAFTGMALILAGMALSEMG